VACLREDRAVDRQLSLAGVPGLRGLVSPCGRVLSQTGGCGAGAEPGRCGTDPVLTVSLWH